MHISSLLSIALAAPAAAQAPEIIHYTFDNNDATNSAVPGVGHGTLAAGVGFGAGGLCAGVGDPAAMSTSVGAACEIDTGWTLDLGTSDWSVGMWLDLRGGGNGFQYFFGAVSGGGFRCFGGMAGDVFLESTGATVVITGGASNTTPTHVVWTYDSSVPALRGYLNGVLNVTKPTTPLNIAGAVPFTVMRNAESSSSMLIGNKIDDFRFYRRSLDVTEIQSWFNCVGGGGNIGTNYCVAVPNSSGQAGVIRATGSQLASANDLTLTASSLPSREFGIFLASLTQGFTPMPGGLSDGNLCLGGLVGRFEAPGQIQNTGSGGTFSYNVDTSMVPVVGTVQAIMAGDTWNFQAWHRDVGGLGSNYSNGLEIVFN